MMQQK